MATRKRGILTLHSKFKVIRQHENGIGSRQLAAEFGDGKKKYPLSKGHPHYTANLCPAEGVAL